MNASSPGFPFPDRPGRWKQWFNGVSLFLLSALGVLAVPALACDIPPALAVGKPAPAEEAVDVHVGLFVIDVFEVDDVAQAFRADVHAELTWRDERLSEASLGRSLAGCSFAHDAIWNPHPRLVNARDVTLKFPKPITVDDDGNVRYSQRFTGLLTARLALREFPFDTQTLPIIAAFVEGMDKIKVLAADGPLTHEHGFSVAGWTIRVDRVVVEPLELTHDLSLPQYRLELTAERKRAYYLGKVLLPVILIVLMAWGAYWLDPGAQPPRFGLSTGSVRALRPTDRCRTRAPGSPWPEDQSPGYSSRSSRHRARRGSPPNRLRRAFASAFGRTRPRLRRVARDSN